MNSTRLIYSLSCLVVILIPILFFFHAVPGAIRAEQKYQVSPVLYDMDCYLWLHYARVSDARLVHWTDVDNAPFGREVHWASPLYWLILLGSQFAAHAGFHDPLLTSCIVVGPMIFIALVVLANAIILVFTRSFGAAAFFNFAIAGSKYLLVENYPCRPDHHGLFSALFCLQCLSLVLAVYRREKWIFCIAGVFAGAGCWIILAQAWPLFLLVAVAALFMMRWQPASSANWAAWAGCAAASSVCFYLIEYYPALPWRLEINHPFYAFTFISWACFFAVFPRVVRLKKAKKSDLAVAVAALLPTLLLISALALGPESVHAMRDSLMFRYHTYIPEFMPPLGEPLDMPFYIVPGFVAAWVLARNRTRFAEPRFGSVLLMGAIVLGLTAAALLECRWAGLLQAATACLAIAIALYEIESNSHPRTIIPNRLCAALLGILIFFTALEPLALPKGRIAPISTSVSIYRALRDEASVRPIILLGAIDFAPDLYAWSRGNIRCVDSSYWENKDGVRAAYEALTDLDPRNSEKILRDRSVDFIAVQPNLIDHDVFLRYGVSDPEISAATTAARLSRNEIPWAKLIAETHNRNPLQEWRIYRVKK